MEMANDKQFTTGRRIIFLNATETGSVEVGNVDGWELYEVEVVSGTDDAITVTARNSRETVLFTDTTTACTTEGYRGFPSAASTVLDTPVTVTVSGLTGSCTVILKLYQGA